MVAADSHGVTLAAYSLAMPPAPPEEPLGSAAAAAAGSGEVNGSAAAAAPVAQWESVRFNFSREARDLEALLDFLHQMHTAAEL